MLFGLFGKNTAYGKCVSVLFRNNIGSFLLSLAGIVCKTLSVLGFSMFTQQILDTISREKIYSIPELVTLAAACLLLIFISFLLEYFKWTQFRCKALTQYRAYTCERLLRKNINAFSEESPSVYLSALSNDLQMIQYGYIENLPYFTELILDFAGTAIVMLCYDIRLALTAFVISLLPIAVSFFRMKKVSEKEEALSVENGRFLAVFDEMIRGFTTIKNTKSERNIIDRVSKKNEDLSRAYGEREHVEISVAYLASIAGRIARVVFFFTALILAGKDQAVSVGVIVAFVQLMSNLSQVAISMPELIANVKAAEKLMEKHERFLEMNQVQGREAKLSCRRGLSFRHVSAGYKGHESVLRDVTLDLPSGSCIAIIGESGSGKTTFLNLLSGIKRDYTGAILTDGVELKTVSEDSISGLVSVVFQDNFIFNDSIKNNISMFGEPDGAMLSEVISKSGLENMVREKGMDYLCGDDGSMLSGGEKQRIGIARCLLRGSEILLFDEVTASLDVSTSRGIFETILSMTGKTRIVITHDIYPDILTRFDRVYRLQNGKFTENSEPGLF